MGKKHAHKRQKTEKSVPEVQPLGSRKAISLLDDSTKDDEERRLESMLFGVPYVPASKQEGTSKDILIVSDEEEEEDLDGANELRGVLDTDLFVMDDITVGIPSGEKPTTDIDFLGPEGSESDAEDEDGDDESEAEDKVVEPIASTSTFPLSSSSKRRKAPAWVDPDDTGIQVSLSSEKRLRKLRDAPSDDVVEGKEYERRLRRQFERINPTPDWAAKARKKLHPTSKPKRRRPSTSDATSEEDVEEEEEGDLDSILASTGGILGRSKTGVLSQGTLSIQRLRDANISARSEGPIRAVQFHPSLPLLLTAGDDRRLKLYNIDGHTNPHLQSVHIPDLPIATALYHPSGSSILLTGPRPFFYTYDLQTGAALRSPRGLWGTTFSGNTVQDPSMEICAFDPTGEVLAVAGRRGYVHLVDWKSGTGQVVGSVKMNAGVKSLWWSRGQRQGELMTLGEDSEVYVWDVAERKCLRRWKDEGEFGSQILGGDRSGNYLGVGSRHGLVNVYGSDSTSSANSQRPKPLRTVDNLTTSVTSMRFNHDSQLLAIASDTKKDQLRMIHLPSLTAFSNWPTAGTPLGHVTSIDFSSGSEYMAIGNTRGRVLLYTLRDFIPQS
ncbi:hypothetical protein EIP91_010367 [Steccherinum ochraceum]|uniref:Uncharacterized protein n=1 Tax=Steccherinum ochraceum TaxID=92696 RepID=A0A4R0RST7_9APHY|nr:hypothetical protein EIP91_010367 [Steccherinum ochraceum]